MDYLVFGNILNSIIDSIIYGTLIGFPVLAAFYFSKIYFKTIDKHLLIISLNNLLLIGSVLLWFYLIYMTVATFYFGGEYEQYTWTNRIFGKYWFAYILVIFLPYLFLPQLLWVKKLRQTIVSTFVIFSVLLLSKIVTNGGVFYFFKNIDVVQCIKQAFIFSIFFGITYFILYRKQKKTKVAYI